MCFLVVLGALLPRLTLAALWFLTDWMTGVFEPWWLAIVGFFAGVAVWLLGGGVMWLAGALCIGAVVPFTFIAIMPTNHLLLAPGRDLASSDTRSLLEKWGRLHGVRSALSLVASIVYVALLLGA